MFNINKDSDSSNDTGSNPVLATKSTPLILPYSGVAINFEEEQSLWESFKEMIAPLIKPSSYLAYYTPHVSIGLLTFFTNLTCNYEAGMALGVPKVPSAQASVGGWLGNWAINLAGWLRFWEKGRFKIKEAFLHGSTRDKVTVTLIVLCGVAAAASIFATSYNGTIDSPVTLWRILGGESLNNIMAWVLGFGNFITSIFAHIYYLHQIVIDWSRDGEQKMVLRQLQRLLYDFSKNPSQLQAFILELKPFVDELRRTTVAEGQGGKFLKKFEKTLRKLEDISISVEQVAADISDKSDKANENGILNRWKRFMHDTLSQNTLSSTDNEFAVLFENYTKTLTVPESNVVMAMIAKNANLKQETHFQYCQYIATELIAGVIGITTALPSMESIGSTFYKVAYGATQAKLIGAGAGAVGLLLGAPAKGAMYIFTQKNLFKFFWHMTDILSWYFKNLSWKSKLTGLVMFTAIVSTVGLSGLCSTDTTETFICQINMLIDSLMGEAVVDCASQHIEYAAYAAWIKSYIWYVAGGALLVNTNSALGEGMLRSIGLADNTALNVCMKLPEAISNYIADAKATFESTPDGKNYALGLSEIATILENYDDDTLSDNEKIARREVQQSAFIRLLKATEEGHQGAVEEIELEDLATYDMNSDGFTHESDDDIYVIPESIKKGEGSKGDRWCSFFTSNKEKQVAKPPYQNMKEPTQKLKKCGAICHIQ